jgi:hypothetical protein
LFCCSGPSWNSHESQSKGGGEEKITHICMNKNQLNASWKHNFFSSFFYPLLFHFDIVCLFFLPLGSFLFGQVGFVSIWTMGFNSYIGSFESFQFFLIFRAIIQNIKLAKLLQLFSFLLYNSWIFQNFKISKFTCMSRYSLRPSSISWFFIVQHVMFVALTSYHKKL